MKLTTILTNNGEAHGGVSDGNGFEERIMEIISGAQDQSREILFYGIEIDSKDLVFLNTVFKGGSREVRKNKEYSYTVALSSNPGVKFSSVDDCDYGVVAEYEHNTDSFITTLQHQYPYAGGEKNICGYFKNGNKERSALVEILLNETKNKKFLLEKKGLTPKEFHIGYYEMYGSIVFNLLLRLGKT